jgi:hypothetical protein
MAYESLLYAFLFNLHPDKALSWLRTALDARIDKETSVSEDQQFRALAKGAFNEWTGGRDLGQEIWERASSLTHHTVEALSFEAFYWRVYETRFKRSDFKRRFEKDFNKILWKVYPAIHYFRFNKEG